MSETPDSHELSRRVSHLDDLFDELRKVVGGLLEV